MKIQLDYSNVMARPSPHFWPSAQAAASRPTPPVRTARARRPPAQRHAHAGRGGEDQGRQTHRRARLAHLLGLHRRPSTRAPRTSSPGSASRSSPRPTPVRCRQAEERRRDDAGQEAEHHPLAAGRSRHGGRGLPARRSRPASSLGFVDNAPKGFVQGKDYVDDRLRRPCADGREGGRRHGRRDRRQGQGRLPLPRRQFLRHQPARPGVQGDDPSKISRTSRSSPSRASPIRPRPRTSSTPS